MKKIISGIILGLSFLASAQAQNDFQMPEVKKEDVCNYVGNFASYVHESIDHNKKKTGLIPETVVRVSFTEDQIRREIRVWTNEKVHKPEEIEFYGYNLIHHADAIGAEYVIYQDMDSAAVKRIFRNRCMVHWDMVVVDYLSDKLGPQIRKELAEGKHRK